MPPSANPTADAPQRGAAESVSREIRLVGHPTGLSGEGLFEVVESPIPDPALSLHANGPPSVLSPHQGNC